jgi:TatD DNase family protein
LELGFHLGIGGVVTYKNPGYLPEVAARSPLERLVLETDCPYLAPAPHRGKRNEPAYLPLVAERLAELRGQSVEQVAAATRAAALDLFHLKDDAPVSKGGGT